MDPLQKLPTAGQCQWHAYVKNTTEALEEQAQHRRHLSRRLRWIMGAKAAGAALRHNSRQLSVENGVQVEHVQHLTCLSRLLGTREIRRSTCSTSGISAGTSSIGASFTRLAGGASLSSSRSLLRLRSPSSLRRLPSSALRSPRLSSPASLLDLLPQKEYMVKRRYRQCGAFLQKF